MRKNSKILWLVFGLVAIIGIGYVIAESGAQWTSSYDRTNGNSHWLVDSSGYLIPGKDNTYTLGSASYQPSTIYGVNGILSGTLAVTGIPTFTTGIDIGSVSTLPTSGYGVGSVVWCTSTSYTPSTPHLYVATDTVTGVSCWSAIRDFRD